jgi:hypothetical protein
MSNLFEVLLCGRSCLMRIFTARTQVYSDIPSYQAPKRQIK